MQIEVRLYATLRDYAPPESNAGVFVKTVPSDSTLEGVLVILNIPAAKVHMRMVNGLGVTDDHVLKDGDRVGLFPPIGGG
jgi:molybdopterin converting factor small subunit